MATKPTQRVGALPRHRIATDAFALLGPAPFLDPFARARRAQGVDA